MFVIRSFLAVALIAVSPPLFSKGTLESQADKSLRHKESGWIFPRKVAGFETLGDAKGIDGTDDVAESYSKGKADDLITATVYVYPTNSPALDASYDGAKRAIVASMGQRPLSQLWSEGPFIVGGERKLRGRKAFYKLGIGADSIGTLLYHYDVGDWAVKVRVTGKESLEVFKLADAFVRELPWTSLSGSGPNCTGYSCRVTRTEPIHGFVPEVIASLLTGKSGIVADGAEMPCDAAAVAAAFSSPPKPAPGGASPVEKVASCKVGDFDAAFVRVVVPQEMLTKLVESPDGLTLSGPFSFVIARKGDVSHYADLHDGVMDAASITAILDRVRQGKQVDFATGEGAKAQPHAVIRFVAGNR